MLHSSKKSCVFSTGLFFGFVMLLCCCAMPAFCEEIKDQSGNPFVLPTRHERLVVLFPQIFGAVYLLGLQDLVIGLPKMKIKLDADAPDGFYFRMAPHIGEAVDVGFPGQPNMETLFSLKPDLVLSVDENIHPTPANKLLRKNGISVLALKGGFGGVTEWLAAIRLIARATGKEGQALKYEAFFREKMKLVRERVAKIPQDRRPKIALVNTNNGQLVIRGSRTRFGTELIRLAGGIVMQEGKDPGDSNGCAEILFSFDPDIIIDDTLVDILKGASWWKKLRAVKNNKVYRTPQDDPKAWVTNWYMSAYSPLGLLWLAKTFHPDAFADIDLDAERNAFYKQIWGIDYKPFPAKPAN